MFSFVLAHRHAKTLGSIALGFRRTFWSKGEVYEMRLPSRGFYYELDPPLPVETLEGRIKGVRQKPFAGYLRKPGVKYSSDRVPVALRFAGEQGGRRGAAVTDAGTCGARARAVCAARVRSASARPSGAGARRQSTWRSAGPPTRSHLSRIDAAARAPRRAGG